MLTSVYKMLFNYVRRSAGQLAFGIDSVKREKCCGQASHGHGQRENHVGTAETGCNIACKAAGSHSQGVGQLGGYMVNVIALGTGAGKNCCVGDGGAVITEHTSC